MRIEFVVEGAPVAKARPRVVRGRAYTPEATKGYEERVTARALNAMNLRGLVMPSRREPVKADVSIGIPMPASWSGRRKLREQCTAHTQRPDVDNLVKVILDGCKGVVFTDDTQVFHVEATKHWAGEGQSGYVLVGLEWGGVLVVTEVLR